jgi:hypothetical protein
MRQADPTVQTLARRLLAHEAIEADEAGESRDAEPRADAAQVAEAAEAAFEKLRLHLSTFLGPDGFQTLLERALTLARAEFPWLGVVQAGDDGSLKGLLLAAAHGRDPAEAADGFTAVLAQFLGLLVDFIGEDLTLRLLRGVWPALDAPSDPQPHPQPHPQPDPRADIPPDSRLDPSGEGAGQEETRP